ncbi:HAD family hydrolase [Streptomyces griseus]|uniref:HAD family hydrolase n=1 Tax=Streptomyces griseus TaxID=1911 RepID=UPI000AAD6589|nr:HAD-IA family hydrolase [Streptomyces griseus]
MASETTQTEQAAVETEKEPDPDTETLRELTIRARVVLWDFDGPICRLFAGHAAEDVAVELTDWLEGHGPSGLLTRAERESLDPHVVLRAVDRRLPGSELAVELEERLTREELRAAESAMPTGYADILIQTWTAAGVRLAIATNNSARAVLTYLASRELVQCFGRHVYGRTQDLHLLKPDPDTLERALEALRTPASAALFIGDTPSDVQAAREAGVAFVGYARNERKAKLLREAGAEHVVSSLSLLLEVVRGRALEDAERVVSCTGPRRPE